MAERWRDEALDSKLKGHEDLIRYFELEDLVTKLVHRPKPMRTTFYNYVKRLPVPPVVEKGSVKEDSKRPENAPAAVAAAQAAAAAATGAQPGGPVPLKSVLKDDVWTDDSLWVGFETMDSGLERKRDSSLVKYMHQPPPATCQIEKLSRRNVERSFLDEDDPQPLDVFDPAVQNATETKKEKKEKKKAKKASKRKLAGGASSGRVKLQRFS
ncbi:hypothetical protein AAMO2058_000669600 [Amorphochlora amoebiformis]